MGCTAVAGMHSMCERDPRDMQHAAVCGCGDPDLHSVYRQSGGKPTTKTGKTEPAIAFADKRVDLFEWNPQAIADLTNVRREL